MTADPYRTLGAGYAARRSDPRIAAHLERALRGAPTDYLPEVGEHERGLAGVDEVTALLRGHGARVEVGAVGVPADCRDGFLAAHWARPHPYLDPAVRAAASGLAVLPEAVVVPALDRPARDLRDGTWHERHGHLLARAELDVGYRLVVSTLR